MGIKNKHGRVEMSTATAIKRQQEKRIDLRGGGGNRLHILHKPGVVEFCTARPGTSLLGTSGYKPGPSSFVRVELPKELSVLGCLWR